MEAPGSARVIHSEQSPGQGASLILRELGVPTAAGQHEAQACREGSANSQPQAGWAAAGMGNSTGGFACPQRKSLATREKSKQTPTHGVYLPKSKPKQH